MFSCVLLVEVGFKNLPGLSTPGSVLISGTSHLSMVPDVFILHQTTVLLNLSETYSENNLAPETVVTVAVTDQLTLIPPRLSPGELTLTASLVRHK